MILSSVFFLLEIVILTKNLVRERDFFAITCDIVGILRFVLVSLEIEPIVNLDINFTVIKRLRVIFFSFFLDAFLVKHGLRDFGHFLIFSCSDEFLQIQFISVGHLGCFTHADHVRGEVWVLTDNTSVLLPMLVLIRPHILQLF